MMRCNVIGSSSKGNAILIEDKLLLDCGVSYAKLKPYLKDIKIIFISHVHVDHLNPTTIKKIAYNYPTIKFLTGAKTVVKKLYDCGVDIDNILYFSNTSWYDLGMIKIKLEPLIHDVENFGLHIEYKNKKCLYIVDTNNVDNVKALGYDLYLIENNYQSKLLEEHLSNCTDDGMKFYLQRAKRTHLSAEQCNSFLLENIKKESEFCYLHQSSFNFKEENV